MFNSLEQEVSFSLNECVCVCGQESDFFSPQGEFRVDKAASPALLDCLMYKMSYYRFGEMQVDSAHVICSVFNQELIWHLTCFSLFSWTSELLQDLTELATLRSETRTSGWSTWRKHSAPSTGSSGYIESKIRRTGRGWSANLEWPAPLTSTNTNGRYENLRSLNSCLFSSADVDLALSICAGDQEETWIHQKQACSEERQKIKPETEANWTRLS